MNEPTVPNPQDDPSRTIRKSEERTSEERDLATTTSLHDVDAPRFLRPPATDTTAARLFEFVELNAACGYGTYFEPGPRSTWIAGYIAGAMGDELGYGDTLLEAVEDALAEPPEAA